MFISVGSFLASLSSCEVCHELHNGKSPDDAHNRFNTRLFCVCPLDVTEGTITEDSPVFGILAYDSDWKLLNRSFNDFLLDRP